MTKLLLLLGLIAIFPTASYAKGQLAANSMPCETYEPNCDGEDGREEQDDREDGEDERPADPNGPDYDGSADEI